MKQGKNRVLNRLDDGAERYYGAAEMALRGLLRERKMPPLDAWCDSRRRGVAHVCEVVLRDAAGKPVKDVTVKDDDEGRAVVRRSLRVLEELESLPPPKDGV